MKAKLLLGNEAVAMAAIHAGIAGSYAYPGTPATEIHEYVARYAREENLELHTSWSANEKVAYEEALGASYSGKRALVSMKHVGLNVAADPFMNSAQTGAHGGLLLVVADDPGMHSSQNEQDSRYYAHFAQVLAFEPSNQQEAYDMTHEALSLSEQLQTPVMLRMVTRLAHSRTRIEFKEAAPAAALQPSEDFHAWTLLPVNARRQFRKLLDKQAAFQEYASQTSYNQLFLSTNNRALGVIVAGIGFNYFLEAKGTDEFSYLKIGTYPPPLEKIRQLYEHVEQVLVIEEGYPYLESRLQGLLGNAKITGKLNGRLRLDGELTPDAVRQALYKTTSATRTLDFKLPGRPPALCRGCPHADLFKALREVMESLPQGRVFSDIGCYTLGALPPYNAINSCVDMGASISMAKGAADVGLPHAVAVIGDSTFAHSGMTPLLGAARDNSHITVIILDNAAVAMTGGQKTMATGEDLVQIVRGLGVPTEHLKQIVPLPQKHAENVAILRQEITYAGLSVVIAKRECIQTAKKKR